MTQNLKAGGKYNKDEIGYEACNFLAYEDGIYYGYVQPTRRTGNIDTTKFGGKSAKPATGVTVVWVSRNTDPNINRTVIVGWYNNATVYPKFQKHVKLPSEECTYS